MHRSGMTLGDRISETSKDDAATVFIVDDDESIRTTLVSLLRSVGLDARAFSSTAGFVEAARNVAGARCLVLDIRLKGESGLTFQQTADMPNMPIVFMTGYADVRACVKAMKAGAHDFLIKPFGDQEVIDAVASAIRTDRARRDKDAIRAVSRTAYETLTGREREVLQMVVRGALNKEVAFRMGISEVTVKMHRGAAMRKMQASSLADLIHKAALVGVVEDFGGV